MAKAVINLQKESGGVVKISPVDGTGVTEVTVPESGELATKAYADLKVALADFTGSNKSLSSSGYQKLPSGLIIQWGVVIRAGNNDGATKTTFPIAFPTACLSMSGISGGYNPIKPVNFNAMGYLQRPFDNTGFYIDTEFGEVLTHYWIAIGY